MSALAIVMYLFGGLVGGFGVGVAVGRRIMMRKRIRWHLRFVDGEFEKVPRAIRNRNMAFDVKRSLGKEPNTCKITLDNLKRKCDCCGNLGSCDCL